jgi:hypothetical protein
LSPVLLCTNVKTGWDAHPIIFFAKPIPFFVWE